LGGVITPTELARVGEAIFDGVPDPDGLIGDDQPLLGLPQTAGDGFAIELAQELIRWD
jgi:hypothetical protein